VDDDKVLGEFFWSSVDLQAAFRADGLFRLFNPAWTELLGWRPEELTGHHYTEFLHPDDVAASEADFEGALARGDGVRSGFVNRVRAKDGTYRWVQWSSRVSGEWSIESGRDITDLLSAERRARASAATVRAIMDTTPDSVVLLNRQLRVIEEAGSTVSLTGIDPAERVGADPLERVHAEDRDRVRAELSRVFTERAVVEVRYRYLGPEGTYLTLETRGRVLELSDREPIGVFSARDITLEVVDRERILEAAEERRALFEAAPGSIVILREDLTIEDANAATELLTGRELSGRIGGSALLFIHPLDRSTAEEAVRHAFATSETVTIHFRIQHRDGHWVPIAASARRIEVHGEGPRRAILTLTDVTEFVATESALEEALAEAGRANRAKNAFISQMSHELRTPLNSIVGYAQLLHERASTAEKREMTELILASSEHLLTIINESLDLSRVESGRVDVTLASVPLSPVIEECVALVAPQASSAGLHLEIEVPEAVDVRADRQRLVQVLLNLLSNAIKYNQPGGSVVVTVEVHSGTVRVGVRDTGPGIAGEDLGRLFTPFDRLGAEATGVEGSGLGLALSKRLAEAMGASLAVESTVGIGSTFSLFLPYTRPASRESAALLATAHSSLVLCIEDNTLNQRLVARFLDFRPHVGLIAAGQASLGLEFARQHHPDLILLDNHLPDLSGGEVIERLAADPVLSSIPVVIVSGDASPEDRDRLLAQGALDYLAKPLDLHRFLEVVDRVLAERAPSAN
jgi:PAS domain S-box-containing protein